MLPCVESGESGHPMAATRPPFEPEPLDLNGQKLIAHVIK
jgi:hypothetical protein